jgi:hypothetical protein
MYQSRGIVKRTLLLAFPYGRVAEQRDWTGRRDSLANRESRIGKVEFVRRLVECTMESMMEEQLGRED